MNFYQGCSLCGSLGIARSLIVLVSFVLGVMSNLANGVAGSDNLIEGETTAFRANLSGWTPYLATERLYSQSAAYCWRVGRIPHRVPRAASRCAGADSNIIACGKERVAIELPANWVPAKS
jgi:hypothetical protein